MKFKILSWLLVFLLISTTFAYADLTDPIQEDLENTAEALSTYEDTDIIINIDEYQPTVLAEQAFESDMYGGYPIFATLTGIKTNPTLDLERITSMRVRPVGRSTDYINSIYYKRPKTGYFDLSNLGYIVIRLKNVKEDEVPRQLDINMTADIVFEIENGFGVNENDLVLPVLTEEEFLNRKNEFSFWSGRGYVRLANVEGNRAELIVYDGMLRKNTISLSEGKESSKQFLSGGTPSLFFNDEEDFIGRNLRDTYKIKVNSVSGSKDKAKVEMFFNGEYKLKELIEGQYLYEGSNLKVDDVKITSDYDEVTIIDENTRDRYILRGGKFYIPSEEETEDAGLYKFSESVKYGDLIVKYAGSLSSLVAAIVKKESNFNSDAIGEDGEVGLMQIMPYTAWKVLGLNVPKETYQEWLDFVKIRDKAKEEYGDDYKQDDDYKDARSKLRAVTLNNKEQDERFDPEKNIAAGTKYIKSLINEFKDEGLALAGYNGGASFVRKYCPEDYSSCSNKDYVTNVLEFEKEYREKLTELSEGKVSNQDEELDEELMKEYNKIRITEDTSCDNLNEVHNDYASFFSEYIEKLENSNLRFKYIKYVYNDLFDYIRRCNLDIETEKSYKVIFEGLINLLQEEKNKKTTEVKYVSGTYQDYFEKAIEAYRTVINDYFKSSTDSDAYKAHIKIAGIYDEWLSRYDEAILEYKKILSLYDISNPSIYEQQIEFLENRRDYLTDTLNLYENGNAISLTLYGAEESGKNDKVTISVNGKSSDYSLKNKFKLEDTDWYLKEINAQNVVIAKTDINGKEVLQTLRLGVRTNIDKNSFILENTDVDEEVHVTILPGEERLRTESNFMLHIPVEPRLWKLSTEQIEDHISATEKAIDFLNNAVNIVENVYKWWSISCYGTFAYLWAKNLFWKGATARGIARKNVMASWKEECQELSRNTEGYETYTGDVYNCIVDKEEEINEDIDNYQRIYENHKDDENDHDRILELAQYDFNNDRLDNKYDSDAFEIEVNTNFEGGNSEVLTFLENKQSFIDEYSIDEGDNELIDKKFDALAARFGKEYNKDTGVLQDISNIGSVKSNTDVKERVSKSTYENGFFYLFGDIRSPVKVYDSSGNPFYGSISLDNTYQYVDPSTKEVIPFKFVNEDIEDLAGYTQKVVLVDSGKWKGTIDRISVDTKAYLEVTKRGADGEPLEVALWERYSNFGSGLNEPLTTQQATKVSDYFTLDNCNRGRTSDDSGRDILQSLIKQHPNLVKTCRDLQNLDRAGRLEEKEVGQKLGKYVIEGAAQETGGLECFDIMDIDDCLTLFSACDPVMCPTSRFTAGGTWKVDNVVSTGIFGSIFLGSDLWDFGRVPPEVGICIPGIDAGMKNYRSLLQGYQECLIARKDKGENVGICDTIRNVGVCKILWREGTAFFRLSGSALDKLLGALDIGQGGGEYGFFQTNIQKTGEFLNFFTKEYATTYFSAYRGASTDEIGEKLCEAAIYGKIPGRGNLLDQLTKPEGPVQFTGWFTEFPHSDVGGEVLSDYEVYYHIYAGEDREKVRYYVYLKDVDDLSKRLYVTKTTGYLSKGDFVDETWRETSYTGYDELCIVIDNQEKCGFGKVSSDLLVDYLQDEALEEEYNKEDIKTEQECRGDESVFSDPSVSELVDALYPNIGENGILRVCSKENPGKGVNEENWKLVGTCGENDQGQELGSCWLSKQSYVDALSDYDLERREEAKKFFEDIDINADIEGIKEKINELKEGRHTLYADDEPNVESYLYIVGEFEDLKPVIDFDLGAEIDFEIGRTYEMLALHLRKIEISRKITEPISEEDEEFIEPLVEEESKKTEEESIFDGKECEFAYNPQGILNLNPTTKFKYSEFKNDWYFKPFTGSYNQITSSTSLVLVFGIIQDIMENEFMKKDLNFEEGVKTLLTYTKNNNDELIVFKNGENFIKYDFSDGELVYTVYNENNEMEIDMEPNLDIIFDVINRNCSEFVIDDEEIPFDYELQEELKVEDIEFENGEYFGHYDPSKNGKTGFYILFDHDSFEVKNVEKVEEFFQYYKNQGYKTTHIFGWASEEGSETYNMRLSEERAMSVFNLISGSREADGYGKTTKFGEGEENYPLNRRVEVLFLDKEESEEETIYSDSEIVYNNGEYFEFVDDNSFYIYYESYATNIVNENKLIYYMKFIIDKGYTHIQIFPSVYESGIDIYHKAMAKRKANLIMIIMKEKAKEYYDRIESVEISDVEIQKSNMFRGGIPNTAKNSKYLYVSFSYF